MPFVHNAWYCIGWSAGMAAKPFGIRILDEDLVVFRTASGKISALTGICPHRFAPLALGKVVGEEIECGYHGLRFDGEGTCTLNPHGRGQIPPRARLRAYPAVEKGGAIWVWMGPAELADERQIIDVDFLEEEKGWVGTTGYLKVDANYRLVVDNLLDLSHAPFIHPNTLGLDPQKVSVSRRENRFSVDGDVVRSDTVVRDVPPPNSFKDWCGAEDGELRSLMGLHLPSNCHLDLYFVPSDPDRPVARLPAVHLLTPETEETTHYFFAVARNLDLDNEEQTRKTDELLKYAFTQEDEPMLRACKEMMRGRDLFSLNPAILETDRAAVYARKAIDKLVAKEVELLHDDHST